MVSRFYRNKSMGLHEGYFGALRNRTGFGRETSWYRTKTQAEIALLHHKCEQEDRDHLRDRRVVGEVGPGPDVRHESEHTGERDGR